MARLTDIAIRNLKPGAVRREIPDQHQRGLYVVVQPTGNKSFCVRYRFAGRPRKLTLVRGIGLTAARKEAADALYQVQQGKDPGAAKQRAEEEQRAAAADTLEAVAAEFFKREGEQLRSAKDWQRDLERLVFPTFGKRPIAGPPVADVRRKDIVWLLDKIEDNNGAGQANVTLAIIRRIMNWHAARSDDFRTPIVRGMGRTKPMIMAQAYLERQRNARGMACRRTHGGTIRPLCAVPAIDSRSTERSRTHAMA